MKRTLVRLLVAAGAASLMTFGCGQPAAAPTSAPPAPTRTLEATKVAYPEKGKYITMIVPWEPGGATDVSARLLARPMEKALGVSIQIVNKPGASSQVGVTELAKAKPDGYTIGWTNLPNSMSPYLDPSRQAAYGRKDLMQVANIVLDPNVFTVTAASKYKTFKDMVDDAKARPEQVKVAVGGIGGPDHVAMLLFQEMTGVRFQLVNFAQGGTTHVVALLAGDVDVSAVNLGAFAAQTKAGTVRFLAVMDDRRIPYPGVRDAPTLKELGYNLSYASSRGISAPAGTPRDAVTILANAAKRAMDDPEVQAKFTDSLLGLRFMDPDEYTRYWDEFERQTKPVLDRLLLERK